MANFGDNDIKQIEDLQQFFGVAGGIVNIVTNATYNMWSKHKPVKFNAAFPDRSGRWWKADNGLCGIAVPSFGNIASASGNTTPYALDRAGWTYFRQSDFLGYKHDAVVPFAIRIPVRVVIPSGQAVSYPSVRITFDNVAAGNLKFAELFENYWLGVILKNISTGEYRAIANTRITSSLSSPIDIRIDNCGGNILYDGAIIDISVIVADQQTEVWDSVLNGTILTLNATAGYSVRTNIPVYTQRPTLYTIGARLGGALPTRYFTVGSALVGSGEISAVASWVASPQHLSQTYNLSSITVTAIDLYNGSVLAIQTFPYSSLTDAPAYIDDTMMAERADFTLATSIRTLTDADGNTIANAQFSYTFEFN